MAHSYVHLSPYSVVVCRRVELCKLYKYQTTNTATLLSYFQDLAARNVLVDKNETCKVSDFGLLREVPKDNTIYVSTYQGPSPLRWMPPESINNRIFSPASDVWSYGILQWEMFNPEKEMPYHNLNDVQMVIRVSEGYRMPIPRGCPGLAAKIMRACWQHEPSNRPSFLLISNLLTQRLLA